MTPEAQRLADELKAAVAIAVRDHDGDHSSDDFVIQRIWDQVDKLASLIPAGGLAEEARDAARWRAMRETYIGFDWAYGEPPTSVALFTLKTGMVSLGPEGADDLADAAMAASTPSLEVK